MPALKKIFKGHNVDNHIDNPLERLFAVEWQKFCRSDYGNIFAKRPRDFNAEVEEVAAFMETILNFPPSAANIMGEQVDIERDWALVCTVIQWLGTGHGQRFLRLVRECQQKTKRRS